MSTFDEILIQSTAQGANLVPGCVVAAVDKTGKTIYSRSSGYDSVLPDAPPIDPKATFWIASCSKLVGTIAAIQCVERGLITLDEPVSRVLPELRDLQIFMEDGNSEPTHQFHFRNATKQITLRQLLTHTSGLGYDFIDPTIMAWRASRGEQPKTLAGTVIEAQSVPLKFEPGEGWAYAGGIDWAGLLVSRLNHNIPLEEYMQENIFLQLGLVSTSFRLEKHPEIQNKLASTSERQGDGNLKRAQKLWTDHAPEDCAGAGLYSTVEDFMKILGDLLKDSPTLLAKENVEEMFKGQLGKGSMAFKGLHESPDNLAAMVGLRDIEGANFALGGMYMEEQNGVMKPATLLGAGLPNLYWFANRNEGVAGFYASQVLPPGDPLSGQLAMAFFQEAFRLNSA
ncbi:putative penicillin-binding protein [Ilyonectria sp. MPI-CAGE-AT-0026]|nr:putative penicillin-binding protein [Ilyonectria sp. MPI-CAGE-AT-0026]